MRFSSIAFTSALMFSLAVMSPVLEAASVVVQDFETDGGTNIRVNGSTVGGRMDIDSDGDRELVATEPTPGAPTQPTPVIWIFPEFALDVQGDPSSVGVRNRPVVSFDVTILESDGLDSIGFGLSMNGFALPTDMMGGTFGGFKGFFDTALDTLNFIPADGTTTTLTYDIEDLASPMYLPVLNADGNPPFSQFFMGFFAPGRDGAESISFAIDNVTTSMRVPEPTTVFTALVGCGLATIRHRR